MYQDRYFVPKRTGTFADVLVTYGLARVLERLIPEDYSRKIHIEDEGPYYILELAQPIRPEWIEGARFFADLVPFVQTGRMRAPSGIWSRDYDQTWRDIQDVLRMRRELHDTLRRAEDEERSELEAQLADKTVAPGDWITVFVGERRMQALNVHNSLARRWWETREHFQANIKTILKMFASPEADLEAIEREWAGDVAEDSKRNLTASQLFNPHQGKGQNRPKANRLTMDNIKVFWLLEYLKAAGLWTCAVPRRVADGDDRKTYVLAPIHLTLGTHEVVFDRFARRLWNETSVKMDCIASLLYADTLLEYSLEAQEDEDVPGYVPEWVVAGFHVAQYKLLSRNAYTMINLGFIGLPAWAGEAQDKEGAKALRRVIREHMGVIDGIREERSEGYNLLVHYRDFLSGRRWEDFFKFTDGFAGYLMRELDESRRHNRPPRQRSFTTQNLEVLMARGKKELMPIVRSQGFRNIARAIRQSTVTLQYLSRERGRSQLPYEIRYGLAQEFLRKAHHDEEFIKALASFAQSYNAENARVAERNLDVWRRTNITEEDLEQVVGLVDEYGAEVVAHLLVAFGYAREPREETEG